MASNAPPDAGQSAMDYAEHDRTYSKFVTMTKWTTVTCIGIMVLLAWLTL